MHNENVRGLDQGGDGNQMIAKPKCKILGKRLVDSVDNRRSV
jgi:hypothetical protein